MGVQNKCGRCSYFRLGSLNIKRSLHLLNRSIRIKNQKEVIVRTLCYSESLKNIKQPSVNLESVNVHMIVLGFNYSYIVHITVADLFLFIHCV